MRVAAIYDIHGNLPALEAVLDEINEAAPDLIVVGGDVAAGPMPAETIERLRTLDVPARFVMGNADRNMVAAYDGRLPFGLTTYVAEVTAWAAQQLNREQRDFLASFEPQVVLPVEGLGEVLFCHATPRSDTEIATSATPDARMREIFAQVDQPLVVCGHTHMQFDRQPNGVRVVNAGSVGMPYCRPGAYWAKLGPEVTLWRTDYDLQAAAEQVRATAYPQAEDFATSNILQPPTAVEALAVFEKSAPVKQQGNTSCSKALWNQGILVSMAL
jgi:putative phosphoesterase